MSVSAVDKRTILVYEPHAEESSDQDKLAGRLASLDGKVIGLLDNTKDMSDQLLEEVKSQLLKDFPKAEFRYFRKKSVSGAAPELMQQVANCDAVVTALGD
jgi:hypothetical protein